MESLRSQITVSLNEAYCAKNPIGFQVSILFGQYRNGLRTGYADFCKHLDIGFVYAKSSVKQVAKSFRGNPSAVSLANYSVTNVAVHID
jgi:hypothetical protein